MKQINPSLHKYEMKCIYLNVSLLLNFFSVLGEIFEVTLFISVAADLTPPAKGLAKILEVRDSLSTTKLSWI